MVDVATPTREQLLFLLYEASELEHNLMCTYLYAAFSLRDGEPGLSTEEAEAIARWRATIMKVAIEEMGHLTAVWNITSALGGSPRFGRANFPLDPGYLPASVVVKLAPFGDAVIQHFIHLERPGGSTEPDGAGFAPDLVFHRGGMKGHRLTPSAMDYDTVGAFYETLGASLRAFVAHVGESAAFSGDPALQLSPSELELAGARPVICMKTALSAFTAIVEQGEGAPEHSRGSHFQKFVAIRDELQALRAKNPAFTPAFPAAHNPVLRRPLRPEGRVWIEDEEASLTVDLANTAYGIMLRLLAYAYNVPRPDPEKALAVDLALGLMRAATHLAERAVRLPAGPSNPECHAGMTFTALRDTAPFPQRPSTWRYFIERFDEMREALQSLEKGGDPRVVRASRILADLAKRAARDGRDAKKAPAKQPSPAPAAETPALVEPRNEIAARTAPTTPPTPRIVDGLEHIDGKKLTLIYDVKKCIHARFCVTGAPKVFIANVKGPWINPDATETAHLVEIAHACPSGAIRYERKDGVHDETPPAVNLLAIREAGPYAVRGDLRLDGVTGVYRATLCRCGASKNKPYCDGSHHAVGFHASGEPESGKTDMLEVRDGPLTIDPQVDGPLQVRGNLEITSGTGRVVARLVQAKMCRCGGSNTKPFCDGTHAKIGFKSDNP